MASSTTRGATGRMASELVRARRREAFLATIRRASQLELPPGGPAGGAEPLPPRRVTPLTPRPEPLPPSPAGLLPAAGRGAEPGRRTELDVRFGRVTELVEPVRVAPEARTVVVAAVGRRVSSPRRPAAGPRAEAQPGPSPAPRRASGEAPRPAKKPVSQVAPVPAGPAQGPGPGAPGKPPLFRAEALQHHLSSEEGRGLVRVSPPWTWALLWVLVAGVSTALAASFVGQVEVTGRARGVVRPTAGVRVLTSQMTGTVVGVDAHSGQRVKAGATLLRIESATTQAQLLEAERDLEAVRSRFSAVAAQQDQHHAEQMESLRSRSRRLAEQIASLRGSEALQRRRVAADRQLLAKGLVSELAVGETQEGLAQAERQLSGVEAALDQTRQELASLEARRQDELWQRQQMISAAQNKKDALELVMRQNVIQAPEDGTVEALLVKEGEVVQAGQAVGKIVPVESPLHVVSFLAEKDRAFVKAGDLVHLELDQLPHAEYGTLQGRVVRIGDDLASPSEVSEAVGEGQRLELPSYRVELDITDARAADAAGVKLRTGTLLSARFTLRRQRLITMVLNPLRRWFQ